MPTRTFSLLAWTVTVLAVSPLRADEARIVPLATVGELHDALITPASDALFSAESELPKDDAAWQALRKSALLLAEAGNLLMLEGRAKDNGRWMNFSRRMRDAAAEARRAADAKNSEALVKANGQLVEICQGCHEPYRDGGRMMMQR